MRTPCVAHSQLPALWLAVSVPGMQFHRPTNFRV